MKSIAVELTDPGWWFSALFVAIIASVLAGFLKDRIEKILATASSEYRFWRVNVFRARKEAIDALVENPQYMSIALHRVCICLCLWLFVTMVYLSAPALIYLVPDDVMNAPFSIPIISRNVMYEFTSPAFGIGSVFIGYKFSNSLSVVFDAVAAFRVKHSLPKLP